MAYKNYTAQEQENLILSDMEIEILDILAEIIFHAFYKKDHEEDCHEQ